MISCIVVDDERIAREGLNTFIGEFDFLDNRGSFANAHLALQKLRSEWIDLVFLDIQMPILNGFELAQTIADTSTMIIFTTAHSEYALKGYEVNAIGYLLKPIFFEDFSAVVAKAKGWYDLMIQKEAAEAPLFFKENGVLIKVLPTQIKYVQGLQNYVEINLARGKSIVVHQTLKSVLDQLPGGRFLQIHKSYLINTAFVSRIDGSSAFLGDAELPIARSRKSSVIEHLANLGS